MEEKGEREKGKRKIQREKARITSGLVDIEASGEWPYSLCVKCASASLSVQCLSTMLFKAKVVAPKSSRGFHSKVFITTLSGNRVGRLQNLRLVKTDIQLLPSVGCYLLPGACRVQAESKL